MSPSSILHSIFPFLPFPFLHPSIPLLSFCPSIPFPPFFLFAFFSFVWYLSSFYFSPVHVFQVDFSVFSPSHYFSSPFSHSFVSLFSIFSISLHLPIYLSSSLSCCHQKNYLSLFLSLSLTFSLPLSLKDEIIFSALICFKKGAVISFLFFLSLSHSPYILNFYFRYIFLIFSFFGRKSF